MKISAWTHWLAGAVAAVSAFLASPAGTALLHQYPKLVPIVLGLSAIGLTYRNPGGNQ